MAAPPRHACHARRPSHAGRPPTATAALARRRPARSASHRKLPPTSGCCLRDARDSTVVCHTSAGLFPFSFFFFVSVVTLCGQLLRKTTTCYCSSSYSSRSAPVPTTPAPSLSCGQPSPLYCTVAFVCHPTGRHSLSLSICDRLPPLAQPLSTRSLTVCRLPFRRRHQAPPPPTTITATITTHTQTLRARRAQRWKRRRGVSTGVVTKARDARFVARHTGTGTQEIPRDGASRREEQHKMNSGSPS